MSAHQSTPLAGMVVGVTRTHEGNVAFSDLLEAAGAEVESFPVIRLTATSDHASLDDLADQFSGADWLVISSANALTYLLRQMRLARLDPSRLSRLQIASVGPKTSAALRAMDLHPELEPDEATADHLVELLIEHATGGTLLWPRSARAKPDPINALRAAKIDVHELILYDTVPDMVSAGRLAATLKVGGLDALTFMSPSAVNSALTGLGSKAPALMSECASFAIGPSTADALRERGISPTAEANPHSAEGLRDALAAWWNGPAERGGIGHLLIVLGLLLGFAGTAQAAPEQEIQLERKLALAPLPVTTFHPLRANILDPLPLTAEIPRSNDTPVIKGAQLSRTLSYASVYLRDVDPSDRTLAVHDYEAVQLKTVALISATNWLAIGGEINLFHSAAGFLDRPLGDFHDAIGVPNGGRGVRPANEYANWMIDRDGRRAYSAQQGGLRLGNMGLFGMLSLTQLVPELRFGLDELELATRAQVKAPTGSVGAGLTSSYFDSGIGLLASWRQDRVAIHSNLDLVFPGGYDFRRARGYGVRRVFMKSMVSAQVEIFDGFAAIVQVAYNSPSMKGPPGLDSLKQGVALVTFAGEILVWGTPLRAGVSEDLTEDGEADFAAFLSLIIDF